MAVVSVLAGHTLQACLHIWHQSLLQIITWNAPHQLEVESSLCRSPALLKVTFPKSELHSSMLLGPLLAYLYTQNSTVHKLMCMRNVWWQICSVPIRHRLAKGLTINVLMFCPLIITEVTKLQWNLQTRTLRRDTSLFDVQFPIDISANTFWPPKRDQPLNKGRRACPQGWLLFGGFTVIEKLTCPGFCCDTYYCQPEILPAWGPLWPKFCSFERRQS